MLIGASNAAHLPCVGVLSVSEAKELLCSPHPDESRVLGLHVKTQLRDPRGRAVASYSVDVVGHACLLYTSDAADD